MSWLMLRRDTVTVCYEKSTDPVHTVVHIMTALL